MKQRSMTMMAVSLALVSGAASAGGNLGLPAGQTVSLPALNSTATTASTGLPAMPLSGSALPALAPSSAAHAASGTALPGLDGLAETQAGGHANAIRPIRIPGSTNIPLPIPGITIGSANGG